MAKISSRDQEYIENRLLAPAPALAEAVGRLRQVGRTDVADFLLEANKMLMDSVRAARSVLRDSEWKAEPDERKDDA